MKKSLLVVPALGVMLLAAAGSVGGTVAWFSSVSSVSAEVGNFQAMAMDGNLSVELTADNAKGTFQGTSTNPSDLDKEHVFVKAGDALTHASVDHSTGKICTISSEATSGVREVATSTWIAKANYDGTGDDQKHNLYWAISWKMVFTYDFSTGSYANLYLDPTSSLTEKATIDQGKTGTINGFRIAFMGKSVGNGSATTTNSVPKTHVWAKNRAASACKYIPSTLYTHNGDISNGSDTASSYGDNVVAGSDYSHKIDEGTIVEDNTTDAAGLLGQFQKVDNNTKTAKIEFTCVAWYEGTDTDVVNNATHVMSSVTANMKFYVRSASASLSA